MTESRARYSSQEAVNMIGNRFELILIASLRVRELRHGYKAKIISKVATGAIVTALQEIEAGLIGRDYLKRIKKT